MTNDSTTTPDPTPAPTLPDPTPDPTPAEAPAPPPTPDAGEESGFAVYDATLLRFVSGVLDKKPTAKEAKEYGAAGHKLEVRKV